jgi:hypothetical protein
MVRVAQDLTWIPDQVGDDGPVGRKGLRPFTPLGFLPPK